MLDIPDDGLSKGFKPPVVTDPMIEDVPDSDPPPAYFASQTPPENGSTSEPPSLPRFKSKAINHVHLSRTNQSIKGNYIIDPHIAVPRFLSPPPGAYERGDNRKNLKLESRNGSIDVDITLLSGVESPRLDEGKCKKRTTMDMRSANGNIDARLHVYSMSTSGILVPYKLKAVSTNGSVAVGLPHDFEGLLTISTINGTAKLSDEVFERVSMSTEARSICQYFIGDLTLVDDDGWKGNEVNIETANGRARVYFVN